MQSGRRQLRSEAVDLDGILHDQVYGQKYIFEYYAAVKVDL